MDGKKIFQRIFSFVLAWVIIFNYCDLEVFDWIGGATDAEAMADSATAAKAAKEKWVSKKKELNEGEVWFTDADDATINKPAESFWADTSQDDVWVIDPDEVKTTTFTSSTYGTSIRIDSDKDGNMITANNIKSVCKQEEKVGDNAFDGYETKLPSLYYTLEESKSLGGWYRRYYVSTATQLASVLYLYSDNTRFNGLKMNAGTGDNGVTNDKGLITAWRNKDSSLTANTVINKVAVTLLCDIDLGKSTDWKEFRNTGDYYLEIDGDGHTIYNFYGNNNYFLGIANNSNNNNANGDKKFEIYDLTFKRCFLTYSYGMFGKDVQYAYFNNVDWEECVAVGSGNVSIVLGAYSGYLYCYFKNCSISNSYVVGDTLSVGHCGLFASYNNDDSSNIAKSTYLGDNSTDFSTYYYTDVPTIEEFEREVKGKQKSSLEGYTDKTLAQQFPSIYENCSTVGSNVYQLRGEDGEEDLYHSGVFVSCIRGGVIFKNCYANGSIFAGKQIGGFIGGILGIVKGFYYPTPDGRALINSCFENCYSTGTVEGSQQLGGFIGIIFNDKRATGQTRFEAYNKTGGTACEGYVLFYNCYTTSSVGMEYSGKYLGGFVGLFRGVNKNGLILKHRFINCYAAGEVGGIDTDVSTSGDESNINKNSIGGFLGMYRPADFGDEGTDGIMTNCYYDKQTTGMRERDIGSMIYENSSGNLTKEDESTMVKNSSNHDLENELKYGYFKSLCGSLTGLTGVYTQKSDVQGVPGLTDSDNIMIDNVWTYETSYYPQLSVFADAKGDDFGSPEKAELARLNSQVSTATVFLNHWDDIMDKDGNIVKDTNENNHAYDTVRDISDLFTFTSYANTDTGKGYLGWELAAQKNKENKFTPYMGVQYPDTDENPDAEPETETVTIDFSCRYTDEATGKSQTDTKTITYDSPEVLMIDADDGRYNEVTDGKKQNGYLFQCYDFAPGKQFVKVTTCEESAYKEWQEKKKAYDDYQDDLDDFNVRKTAYIMKKGNSEDAFNEYVKELINANDDDVKSKFETIVNVWIPAYEKDGSYEKDLIEAYKNKITNDMTDEEVKAVIASNNNEVKQCPVIEPTKKDKPDDFSEEVKNYTTASRIFRLIPTAYLEAGDVITVNVSENNNVVGNKVTLATRNGGSETLPGFDHTVGVLFASTQSLPLWVGSDTNLVTRLGDDNFYNPQNTDERDADGKSYYVNNKFNNGELEDNKIFALYSYFPSKGSGAENGENYGVEDGFKGLINKVSIGKFYPDGRVSDLDKELEAGNVGKTKVEVYEAVPYSTTPGSDDDDTYTILKKGDKVSMTDDNLKKWSGQEKFTQSDSGDYLMCYYWRLTDGRYITRTRLVKILISTYSIEMRTGVANDTTDSFNTSKNNTNIDCNVLEEKVEVNGDEVDGNFPSDNFASSGESWEEYVKYAYDTDDYGEIMAYPDENGVKYWTKSKTLDTSSPVVSVAWRRNADYRLVKLIVEVRTNSDGVVGEWGPMMTVDYSDSGKATIEDDNLTFEYNYRSYAVSQNSQTKRFSVIETNSAVRQFAVNTNKGVNDTAVKYINFNFVDSGEGQSVELSDDIRVTALFKTVAANVDVEKYALIDNGDNVISIANDNEQSLATADEYRSVDNAPYDNFTDKKAVLFGDKIIYRMKVKNTGLYNANNVIVSDTVPDGCTLVDGSVKIYRQKVEEDKLSSTVTYGSVVDIGANSKDAINDVMAKDNASEKSYWTVDKDSNGKTNIKWILNPVNTQYDYYVQYEVTVDGDYDDVKNTIKNKADFTYAYINGDSLTTGDDFNDEYNSGYPTHAAYNTSTAEVTKDGKIKYTVEFTAQDENVKDYSVYYINNDVPSGYELVPDSDIIVSGLGEVTISKTDTGFEIKPNDDIKLEIDDTVTVTFEIQKSDADAPVRMENISRLYFKKTEDDKTSILQSAITKVDSSTNEVESEVRWLYLNLEKDVPVDDNEDDYPFDSKQAFVFKTMNSASGAVYTDLYANNNVIGEDGKIMAHSGNKLLQITKRGDYTVSEEDWAGTNYDLSKTKYSAADINFKSDDLKTDGITTTNGENGNASMYLPRAMYTSTAIPLWAIEDEDGNRVYPTVACTNYRSDYAWLTAEKTVENSFTTDASQTTAILALARKAAENSSEDNANSTPEAVVETPVLAVVEEEKE